MQRNIFAFQKKLLLQKFIIQEEEFWLSPNRMLYWPAQQTLIIADLHFGKTGHFRKSGIAVPQNVFKQDLHQLFAGIQFHKPASLLIVGDMFHSRANKEMDLFTKWRNDISYLDIHLIKGNHDILNDDFYKSASIRISEKHNLHGFSFIHDMATVTESINETFFFSGHVHPGISIRGGSRQSLSFPCFYFTKQFAILPAFSVFSGYYIIRPKKGDKVFAIVENTLVQVQ